MNEIIKSKDLVSKMEQEMKDKASNQTTLLFVLVGEDPASQIYVRNKVKACERVGIKSLVKRVSESVTEEDLITIIELSNLNPDIKGIIVQQPLPKHLNATKIINKISPDKDVDGFGDEALAGVMKSGIDGDHFSPATPLGIMKWIEHINYDLTGKHVVIVGRSNTVSKPLAMMMLSKDATVTVCHSKTRDLEKITKQADVLVSAIGKPYFITNKHVSDNTLIFDVGINRLTDGKIVGDCDITILENNNNITLTAVPGGVGPLTIASLIYNTLK